MNILYVFHNLYVSRSVDIRGGFSCPTLPYSVRVARNVFNTNRATMFRSRRRPCRTFSRSWKADPSQSSQILLLRFL